MANRLVTGQAVLSVAMTVVLLAFGAPASATASEGSSATPAGDRLGESELGELLDPIVAAGAPGAAVRLDFGGRVQTAAAGQADLRGNRPMRPELNYRAGSLTKPMVATVVLQLVGEGRLALTDTVDRWLPGILPYGDRVTVRHLLTMTSGVPEYLRGRIAIDTFGLTPARLRTWTPRELVALVTDQPPTFAAGTGFEYSNTNYVLAGMIVEAVTGNRLGWELTRRIFRPLGMRDTRFPVHHPAIAGRHAHGYSLPVDPQGSIGAGPLRDVTVLDPSFAWASGNVTSDLADLTRFLGALLAGRLLPPALLAEMTTPVDTGDPDASYGMGLEFIHTPCGTVVGHSGSIAGFHTIVLADEDGHRRFVLMTNQYLHGPATAQAFNQAALALMRDLLPDTCSSAVAGRSLMARR
jgi:D-alanyl-D-alanine carboxypeptidase